MDDTNTISVINPISVTPRENTDRPAGAVGYFDDLEAEKKSAVAAAERIVNTSKDIFSATTDLLSEITGIGNSPEQTAEETGLKQKLEIGGETEKVFNDPDQVSHRKVQEVIRHYAEIDQAVKQVPIDRIQKLAKDLERVSGGEFGVLDVKAESQPNVTNPDLDSPDGQNIALNTAYLIWDGRAQKLKLTQNPPTNVTINIATETPTIGFNMRQGEMQMGTERVGGGHFTTAPG